MRQTREKNVFVTIQAVVVAGQLGFLFIINYCLAEIGRLARRNGEQGAEWRKIEEKVKSRGLRPRGGWVGAGFVGEAEMEAKVGERSGHPKQIGNPRAEKVQGRGSDPRAEQRSKSRAEIQEQSGDPRAERRSKGGGRRSKAEWKSKGGAEIQEQSGPCNLQWTRAPGYIRHKTVRGGRM